MSLLKLEKVFFSTVDMPSEEEALQIIDFCLKVETDVNIRDKDSYTLLHRAADRGKELIFKKLLESGANVNLQLDDQQINNSASILGCAWATKDSFYKMVLDSGVDINLKGLDGKTALLGVIIGKFYSKAKMLIEKGADVNIADKLGNTPLIMSDDLQTTKLLLEKGANIDHQNRFKETALMWAVSRGSTEMVKVLLEAGADTSYTCFKGNTALDYAKNRGSSDIIALFIEGSMNKNEKKFITVAYKVHINLPKGIFFEGSMVNGKPKEGFIVKSDGARYPVKYINGDFILTGDVSVNSDGKVVVNV